jgi:hypothetical protein
MTLDEYLTGVEKATGQSREHLRARGIWAKEGHRRLIACPGFHLTTEAYEAQPSLDLDTTDVQSS